MTSDRKVCIAVISGPHGVRGLVRLRSFTADPKAVSTYRPVTDLSGQRSFAIELLSASKGQWLARIDGVGDRDAAESLRGQQLFVDRAQLPALEGDDEFYHTDLIGLAVEDETGKPIGTVRAVHDFGAGDVLEISRPEAGTVTLPFTREIVPIVDITGGRVVVLPPAGLMEDERKSAADGGTGDQGERG